MSEPLSPAGMPALEPGPLWSALERVVSLGNRYAGTPGEARAREWLLDEFERAGLSGVHAEEFRFLAYEPEASSCTAPGHDWESACAGLQFSADGVAEGEAVYLGSCRPEDVAALEGEGVELRGKVAVAHSYHTWLVAPQLAEKGVAALVNVGDSPDGLVGHFPASFYPEGLEPPWEGRILPFPGATIEMMAARRLLSLMSAGPLRLRVEHRARYLEKTSANVLGELPGGTDERVVVGAHYDTQLEGPGAADNSTGLATLLELARAWRGLEPRRTVTLAAFGVEELACWGSWSYLRSRPEENERTVGMVNLDALGLPFPGTRVVVADRAMAPFARESAAASGWEPEAEIDASLNCWGDHNPFIDAGVPAVWLWRYPPQHPYYHTAGDVLRYVEPKHVLDVAEASAYTAYRLAQLQELQLGRSQPSQVWASF